MDLNGPNGAREVAGRPNKYVFILQRHGRDERSRLPTVAYAVRVRNPKPGTRFATVGDRLALFHGAETHDDYWRAYWVPDEIPDKMGFDDLEYGSFIARFASKYGVTLEAGCGSGGVALALHTAGYPVIGIDKDEDVLHRLRAKHRTLPLYLGDVRHLAIASGRVDLYISVGVIEHFHNGPGPILAEARRVLRSGKTALISVPLLNHARKRSLAAMSGIEPAPGLHFHQFYFGIDDLAKLVRDYGFELIDVCPYGAEAFLIREHPAVAPLWQSRVMRERMKNVLRPRFRALPIRLKMRYAHMVMAACVAK